MAASISAYGKTTPATAIVLFEGPKGAAYIQISGTTLNGKTELRICDGVPKFDKRIYDNLPRTQLSGATSLERDAAGVINMTVDGKQVCVVPSSLKFDKNAELTPAQAADQAVIQGVPVSGSTTEAVLPEFKPGVRLVFVPAPDPDLAEYLRTQRANSAAEWQDFLRRFPASSHAAEARSALAELHQHAADAAFARYQDLSSANKMDLALLKQACTQAQVAGRIAPGSRLALTLLESIGKELDRLLEPDRTALQAYRQALQNHGLGYSHLAAARQHVGRLLEVRPEYAPVMNLQREIDGEEQKLDSSLGHAESLVAARRYDDGVAALEPFASFAAEVPRIEAVLDADFGYHLSQGKALSEHQDWDPAIKEFRQALAIRRDSRDAATALSQAETQLAAAQNQQAANLAVLQSDDYAGKGDFIEAYNALVTLPEAQRVLVAPQMSALARSYVTAASRRAQKLQETHLPIKSRADEDAIRQAGEMLDRANAIASDPGLKLKRDFLFGKLSSLYLEQAKRHFGKPVGSGVGVGWLFLREAQRYDADIGMIKDQVKDLMAANENIYQRRARLSVGIVIRDQTSRQGTVGFADQMADAVANGLEPAGTRVDVVRGPAEVADGLQPNFLLVGEILEHRVVKNTSLETLSSQYRAGTHEVKNTEWLKANSDFQAAQQLLTDAQRALDEARTQHKKKEVIAAASDSVQQAQQHSDESRHALEAINQTRVELVVEPYSYSKRTVDLAASIDLLFRITDHSGVAIGPPVDLHKGNHKSAVVLDNVKPEDTEGVINRTAEPDDAQFLADLEIEARDALVKSVREKTAELPAKILQEARNRAQNGDNDGAGEDFVLYLNATADAATPERDEAAKFLRDQFNISPPVGGAR